jgi:hypothetical protein
MERHETGRLAQRPKTDTPTRSDSEPLWQGQAVQAPAADPTATIIAIIALIVASYAALISTGQLLWNIYVGVRDRSRVTLTVGMGMAKSPRADQVQYLVILSATNKGRRPATLEQVGVDLKESGRRGKESRAVFPFASGLPAKVDEGERVDVTIPLEAVQRTLRGATPARPTRAWVRDATRRYYYTELPRETREVLLQDGVPW